MNYSIINDVIDGETNWYYYPSGKDYLWDIIKADWLNSCSFKYFHHVAQKRVMITGGAHVGMYSRFYAKQFQTVYAFEPDPFHFFCLVNNTPKNVVKFQAALGFERTLVSLYQSGCNGHLTLSVDQKSLENLEEKQIPVLRIDDLNLPMCDLIQLDVEYFEYQALKGAIETIERCEPVIIAENGNTSEISSLLKSFKYEIIDETNYDTIWRKT